MVSHLGLEARLGGVSVQRGKGSCMLQPYREKRCT